MWMKQVGYKPRANSQSSPSGETKSSSTSTTTTNPLTINPQPAFPRNSVTSPTDSVFLSPLTSPTTPISNAARRRSSAGSYAGLEGLKRKSQDDTKRATLFEQRPGGDGAFAGMWNKFVRGT